MKSPLPLHFFSMGHPGDSENPHCTPIPSNVTAESSGQSCATTGPPVLSMSPPKLMLRKRGRHANAFPSICPSIPSMLTVSSEAIPPIAPDEM